MRDRGVSSRYAHALVDASRNEGILVGVAESYAAVVEFAQDNETLTTFLEGPQVAEAEKISLMKTIFDQQVEELLLNFFVLLIKKNRIDYLKEIGEVFAALVEQEQGYQRAEVTTAVVLAADQEEALAGRLAALTGSRIILDKKVDPAVIGGVLVMLGDQILDGTVRTRLAGLRSALAGVSLR